MEREEKGNKHEPNAPVIAGVTEGPAPREEEEVSAAEAGTTSFREIFRNALNRARREHKSVTNRKELSRDKSKSMFLLASVAVVLLLLFLGLFSAPKKTSLPSERRNGPNLGRKVTPGQEETGQGKSAIPLLDASQQPGETAPGNPVTAEEVDRTSRSGDASMPQAAMTGPEKPSPGKPKDSQQYALKGIDFSDPAVAPQATAAPLPPAPPSESSGLKKPSIVFVRRSGVRGRGGHKGTDAAARLQHARSLEFGVHPGHGVRVDPEIDRQLGTVGNWSPGRSRPAAIAARNPLSSCA